MDRAYQREYMELLASVRGGQTPPADGAGGAEACAAALREQGRASRRAVQRGTQLLREGLFPMLDNVLSASQQEIDELTAFASGLTEGNPADIVLHYRIHMALTNYARHWKRRDMLIRELYQVGMALYQMERLLSPSGMRPYSARMRLCFAESASYFETEYDRIEDPETRGYIHRSMGNIALSYGATTDAARLKLEAVTRSIRLLSDPELRAKTPSLPWDTYLYKSHMERTALLPYLRSGRAEPEAFVQVLESAQIVERRQAQLARERGESLQPRWQYAYLAAQYHCGALELSELLEGIYALAYSMPDDDFGAQSVFSHVGTLGLYLEYAQGERLPEDTARQVKNMVARLCAFIVRAPAENAGGDLMFYLRQALYFYRELPGCPTFLETLQTAFAARDPVGYVRMGVTSRLSRTLCAWAIEDCPEKLAGLPGCARVEDVIWGREALLEMAANAGKLCDAGMIHFLSIEELACRGLFEEEETLLQMHAYCGADLLRRQPSTAIYADVANGHHRAYDDSSGYPLGFSVRQSPMRAMIFLVAAADALSVAAEETAGRAREPLTAEQAARRVLEGAGKRYAPFVAELLRAPGRVDALREDIPRFVREAAEELLRRREAALRGA